MPWRPRYPSHSPKIAIVGGGVASFVAGIVLRERLPNAEITLYCAASETMAGGQLASWNEQGYPIEHGLHALFGFYDHILPLLKKIGAYENLTRSKEHIFVRERGEIRRFDLRTWPASYRGFTAVEKGRFLAAAPAICKLLFDVKRKGQGVFDAFDQYDLRQLARKHGVAESVLQSGFVRQFYEAAFNAPSELSAAVALESIYKIFSRKWHYYFNSPTRESIIAPLQRHFADCCRGKIEFGQKLIKVRSDALGRRVVGLDFQNQSTGDRVPIEADEHVLALGLEDFKMVDFGAIVSRHDYFRNLHKLQTVSSFSIQAWFKEDPVPVGIDSMLTGMPEPFGILCPITRVRATQPPDDLPLRYEIIATGPERGFEEIPDQDIKAGFVKGLVDAGFKIPDNPVHMHVVLRRNRESFHRYLLTRPGELHWRPAHQSPLENLCLAGAWVRNEFALPCVDAAAEGAIKVAELIAARALVPRKNAAARWFSEMPRGNPLLLPPPYHFPRSSGSLFLLNANPKALTEAICPELKLFPGLGRRLLLAVLRHEDVHAECDPTGARYAYNEVLLAAFVRERGLNAVGRMGLYPISLYVDDDTAMAAGREVYGFPKKMARIDAGARAFSVVRCGLLSDAVPGPAQPIKVLSAHWSANSQVIPSALEDPAIGVPHLDKPSFALPSLAAFVRLMAFYNTHPSAQIGEGHSVRVEPSQLTKVALTDLNVGRVSPLQDLRLRVEASLHDPIYRLMQAERDGAEIRAGWGAQVELSFSMGSPRIVEAA